jgi:hypothetical protein
MAVAANSGADANRRDMCTGPDATAVQAAAGANRADMRAGMNTLVTHTRPGRDDRAGMTARGHTMFANPGPGANTADMGAGTHAMCAGMNVRADAQDIDPNVSGKH